MTDISSQTPGLTEALGEHASNPSTPKDTGEIIFSLGRDWKVSSLELRIKAQFEQHTRSLAMRTIKEIEDELGPEEGSSARSQYIADRAAGHYNWDGRFVRSALDDLPGIQYLLFLLLRRCQPEVTVELASKIAINNPTGCGMAIKWALGNSQTPSENGTGMRQDILPETATVDLSVTGGKKKTTPVTLD